MLRCALPACLVVLGAFAFLAGSTPLAPPWQPIQFSHRQHLDYFQSGRHRQSMVARHKEILLKEFEDEETVGPLMGEVERGSCTLCHRDFNANCRNMAKLNACAECHRSSYGRDWEGRKDQRACLGCHKEAGFLPHASIPNNNTCAACHLPALGDDSEEAKLVQFVERKQEISWTRVYDYLPSEIVFSHERHAELGRVKCQECHGHVERTEQTLHLEVKLSMEDCMDCHAKTGADNDCLACHR